MKTHITYLAIVCAALSGCASKEYKGQGEYFELRHVNIVERDLSPLKPTIMSETKLTAKVVKPKAKPVPKPIETYLIREGESFESAIRRWLKREGYRKVAWSMNTQHQLTLSKRSSKQQRLDGSFKKVWDELSAQLGVPLKLVEANQNRQKVVGVYDFDGKARITHVGGQSLKAVTQRVVENYEYIWVDTVDQKRSWLSPNDYKFSADYYLLTAWDDVEYALSVVLEGYPVRAAILDSTGQVFIQEDI